MQLETVTAEIRPRTDWEAVDLGFAMVRRDFWRCFAVWWLAALPVVALGWWLWDRPLLWLVLFWWWKPAGSRMVLFEISRRLFGERPGWRSVWRELPRAWTRRFFYRFLWARFSPWLPVTLPVEDLERLRGKAYRVRAKQVVRRGEGAIIWTYLASDLAAIWFGVGVFGFATMFLPEGQAGPWALALETWDADNPGEIPLLLARTAVACLVVSLSLTDLFLTGAGFGIYINNRTWLEGWDVELAFRRLARRLGKAAVVLVAGLLVFAPGNLRAQEQRPPDEVIAEVKAHEDFEVHTVKQKVPVSKSSASLPVGLMATIGTILGVGAAVAVVGFLGWMIWRYRHVFLARGGPGKLAQPTPVARVVMGMEVTPESLPPDVPSAAWLLWQQGRRQEALGLLYRGAISRAIDVARVEIRESDTEGDCLRRVEAAGQPAHPKYFRSLTAAWMETAYAATHPPDGEVEALCQQWPFGREGGRA